MARTPEPPRCSGTQKARKRREDREQYFDHGLVDPPPQAQHHPADTDAPQDLADEDGGECSGRFDRGEDPEAHGSDGEAIEDERGRIVSERFAFEHDEDAARDLHSARDGERGDGVGRGDDGAKHEAHGPRKIHQPMRCRRDRERGEDDAADGEKPDRTQVEAELAPAHLERRGVDDGRQHEQQHDLGRELDRRQAGHEREQDAGDDQRNGWRNLEPVGDDGDRRDYASSKTRIWIVEVIGERLAASI